MRGTAYSLACALCCGVLLRRRLVVAHAVHAAGEAKMTKFVSSASFFSTPRTVLGASRYLQRREEQGQKRDPREYHQNRDGSSLLPSSCDYSPSFVQKRVDAASDVSCFPHDQDIGSKAESYDTVEKPTVQECLQLCRANDKCSHYTWNKQSRVCHLKSAPPVLYTYKGDMTGPKSCDTTCFVGCLTYDTTPLETLEWTGHVPALCQSACWAKKDCVAFVLVDGKCQLFGRGFSAYRVVSGGNSLAGPKNLCERPSDLRLRELIDGHRIGSCLKSDHIASASPSTAGIVQLPNVAACQQRCKATRGCNHFTYNVMTKQCYMKQDFPPDYAIGPNDITGDKNCVPD